MAALICRFSKVRVTARFACRFGTTMPNQTIGADTSTGGLSGVSSTGLVSLGISLVDNCASTALWQGFLRTLGVLAKWCTAKCGLRAWLPVFSTRSKSTAWVIRSVMRCCVMHLTMRPRPWPPDRIKGARANSDCQALAALGAACVDHGASTARLHADEKAVGAGPADFRSLVSAFHGDSKKMNFFPQARVVRAVQRTKSAGLLSGKPTITPKGLLGVNAGRSQVFWITSRDTAIRLWITCQTRRRAAYN